MFQPTSSLYIKLPAILVVLWALFSYARNHSSVGDFGYLMLLGQLTLLSR